MYGHVIRRLEEIKSEYLNTLNKQHKNEPNSTKNPYVQKNNNNKSKYLPEFFCLLLIFNN